MRLPVLWKTCCGSEEEPEPLHPKENPILQGYLLPSVHGTYRRYVLELLVMAGLLLPWIGPAFGLAIMTPIVLLTVQNSKLITTERECFGGGVGPTTCPATSYFDYYFWNLTNPDQFLAGTQPPALEQLGPYVFLVQETRWNVSFSSDYSIVNYSSLNFQTFVPEQSCRGCSLTDNSLITVNRGYLALLASPLINYNDALAFIPAVPLAMRQIVAGIQAALVAGGVSPAVAPSATVSQWGRAAFGYPAQLTGVEDPRSPEFANWLHVYQGFSYLAASAVLTDPQAGTLLTLFQGDPALDTPGSYDGANNVILFAFYPAAAVAAVLSAAYPSLGLGVVQIQAVQGYLYWVCQNFIVPSALYGGPAGQLLGPAAGGLLVKRSINDWLYGWRDPLIQQNVSMAFAWPANDTASRLFGVPTTWLNHLNSPLIFDYSLDTGLARDKEPYNLAELNGQTSVVAYPATPLPFGAIPVRGSSGGLSFPLNVRMDSEFTMFDTTFNRPLNVSFTGQKITNQGVSAWHFGLIDREIGACNVSEAAKFERCAYPDVFTAAFNASLTYNCPTILTYPHFYKADPALPRSTGFSFAPNAQEHDWLFSVEPVSGFTTTGRKGYQLSHQVKRSAFLYPTLWQNSTSTIDGLWMPTFWVRSRFEPTVSGAKALSSGLQLRRSLRIYPAYVVPPVFGFLLAVGVLFLGLTPGARRVLRECAAIRGSHARSFELTFEEAVSVSHIPDSKDGDPRYKHRSSILTLEERFEDFYWDASESSEAASARTTDFTPREYCPVLQDSSLLRHAGR